MRGPQKLVQTSLVCEECGYREYIWRKAGRQRPCGHIKHMWCYRCKERTAHIEEPHPVFQFDAELELAK